MSESVTYDAAKPELKVERIYTKSISFDMTNVHSSEKIENIQPQVNLDIKIDTASLKDNLMEVILTLNATAKANHGLIYYAKVQQAGIFGLTSFTEEQKNLALNVICTSILYPYACERISNLSIHAGFPPLTLAPINFEALYQKNKSGTETDVNAKEPIIH